MKPPPPVTRAFVNIVFLSAVLRAILARGAEHQAPTGIGRSSLSRILDLGSRVQGTAEEDQRTSRHLWHNLLSEGTPALSFAAIPSQYDGSGRNARQCRTGKYDRSDGNNR